MIFDTHAHFKDAKYNNDRNLLLSSMKEKGVSFITEVSAGLEEFEETVKLTKEYDFIYGSIGVHPYEISELKASDLEYMEKFFKNPKIVAVGETGLDYFGDDLPSKDLQKIWFENQIELAKKVKKPIIVHSREACEDTFEIMKNKHCEDVGGVVHCFSYSKEMALEYIKMGFYIGVGGVVTFKNGKKLKEVVKEIPLESIVLETDCPYLAPVPHRGERNDSSLIKFVVQEISALKGIDEEDVIKITCENSKKMYRI